MFRKEYKYVYITSIFITLFFIFFYFIDFILDSGLVISTLEKKWFDFKISYNLVGKFIGSTPKDADKRIIIVGIDDPTIERYGWPFPRKYYAKAIDVLNKYSVKVIGFDVMFLDPDRNNPQSDKIFVDTVKKHDNVILGVSFDDNLDFRYPFKELHLASENFGSLFAGNIIDYDGNIRKIYPFIPVIAYSENERSYLYGDLCPHCPQELKNAGVPLLGMMAYIKYSGKNMNDVYKVWKNKKFYINFRKSKRILDEFYPTTMYKYISIKDIIEDNLTEEDKKTLFNSIVFIGSVVLGAYDHYSTPVHQHTPGVEIHALCVDNILNDDYLRDVPWYVNLLLLLIFIWLPVILIKNSVTKLTIYNFIPVIIIMIISVWLLKYHINQYFMAFFLPNVVSFVYIVAYKSIVEDRQKRWIKNTFSQYLSPEVVDILVKDPSKLKLGGERRDLSVLFMDIAGFTSMSEKMTPEEVTNLLNFYLSSLSEIILDEKGVIDKYIGDCIMAFWNAPLNIEKHRFRAVSAAIKCIRKIEELNNHSNVKTIRMRIGINSGYAVVGNMGSNKRFSYTALGDTVNLASRLEGANKFFGTYVMVSSDVYDGSKDDIVFKYIGNILVPGKTEAVEVYEPYKFKNEMTEIDYEFMKNFENGIKYFYEKKYDVSIGYFDKALAIFNDSLSLFYKKFAISILEGKEVFDGSFNIRSK